MKIFVAGTAITPFGELWDRSLEDLLRQATAEAVANAELDLSQIEAVFVANMAAGALEGQMHLGALVSSWFPQHPPAMRIEGACASGGLAMLAAEQALLSGKYKTVLVVGGEKLTDVSAAEASQALAGAAHIQAEYGSTFPGLYALLAQQHQAAYGTTREQLSAVSVKNHRHALDNPFAQYHKEFSLEQVSNSAMVASPLRLLDCSPLTDGASAVVLTTEQPIQPSPTILGTGHGMDSLTLAERDSLTSLGATKRAAQQAFAQAGVAPADIEVAEVHDCFTIAELLALEDLGFFEPGVAGEATLSGQTTYGGQVVVNPSGGLKASGHPVGASGVKQVAYLANLLKEGKFKLALAHNVGGSGATAVVHIMQMETNQSGTVSFNKNSSSTINKNNSSKSTKKSSAKSKGKS